MNPAELTLEHTCRYSFRGYSFQTLKTHYLFITLNNFFTLHRISVWEEMFLLIY